MNRPMKLGDAELEIFYSFGKDDFHAPISEYGPTLWGIPMEKLYWMLREVYCYYGKNAGTYSASMETSQDADTGIETHFVRAVWELFPGARAKTREKGYNWWKNYPEKWDWPHDYVDFCFEITGDLLKETP